MNKFFVLIIWLLITASLIKYSLYFSFDYDAGNVGPVLMAFTALWMYAFFKKSSK